MKTLYVIDVRLPEEYEKGHLEYVKNVPGGQLIQTTDEHLAVRNSRVVLVDDTEARATITASWLLQMGWTDVHVLEGGIGKESLVRGTRPQVLKDIHQADLISPVELKTLFDASERVLVLDLANSVEHRKGHIFGAFWTTRSNIYKVFSNMTLPEVLIITSPDNTLAHLAAGDFGAMWPKLAVKVLEGGTQAWKAAGMPTATGMAHPLSRENDVWIDDCERKDATKKDMLAYLLWEEALLEQVKREDEMFLN